MKPPIVLEPQPSEPRPHEIPPNQFPQLDLDTRRGKTHWWVWLLVFAAIAYGCYRLYVFETAKKQAAMTHTLPPAAVSVPIVAARAFRGNMPVYLQGLGNITAFNTVTVKTRIDGPLINVAFREGQFVHQGDLLAEIDPRPYQVALAQAEANLARDQAALKDAQVNYQRDQELYKDQIIAKQQLDTQAATADEARAAIAADEAAIASAKLNLSYTRITAPISGRVGLRLVDAGNIVHAADTNGLVVITQMQPIAALFSIPEDQLPPVLKKLREGAKLPAEAYDRDNTEKIASGTLLTVDNEIDATTGTSKLKAVFPNENLALFPNQFVNVRLWLDTKRDATIIPPSAIQRGPSGTFVYVVQPDSRVTVRPVKLGLTEPNEVSVDAGVSPGDNVVVDGAEKLAEGMKVSVREATPADLLNLSRRQPG